MVPDIPPVRPTQHHILPPKWVRESRLFKRAMDWLGTRREDKRRAGWSPVDIEIVRRWDVEIPYQTFRVYFDEPPHR